MTAEKAAGICIADVVIILYKPIKVSVSDRISMPDEPIITLKTDQKQVFSDLIALDSWFNPRLSTDQTTGIFVEVTFLSGRIGGEDDDFPFTFRVRLQKAVLKAYVENPIAIDRATITRPGKELTAKLTAVREAKKEIKSETGAGFSVSPEKIKARAAVKLQAQHKEMQASKVEISEDLPRFHINPIPMSSERYSWEISPTFEDFLDGQPWDAGESPLFRVKLTKLSNLDPAIRIEIECKQEDIIIYDLKFKESASIAQKLSPNKDATVRNYLKKLIIKNGLSAARADDRFSQFIIAHVFCSEGLD
jgi:hypothetical protein